MIKPDRRILPAAQATLIDQRGVATPPMYDFMRRVVEATAITPELLQQMQDLLAQFAALEAAIADLDLSLYTQRAKNELISGQWTFLQQIQGADGTAERPEFSFRDEDDSGFYRLGDNNVGISTEAVHRWDIDTTRVYQNIQQIIDSEAGLLVRNPTRGGTSGLEVITDVSATPSDGVSVQMTFWEDDIRLYGHRFLLDGTQPLTGDFIWYRHQNDANGVEVLRVSRTESQLQGADGSITFPFYGFSSDRNLGMYRLGADQLGLSALSATVIGTNNANHVNFIARNLSGTGFSSFSAQDETGVTAFHLGYSNNTNRPFLNIEVAADMTLQQAGAVGWEFKSTRHWLGRDSVELQLGTGADLRLFHDGTNSTIRNDTGDLLLLSGATESLRIATSGAWGLGGANYGTEGQVLTSHGSSAVPTWEDAEGGGSLVYANIDVPPGNTATGTTSEEDFSTTYSIASADLTENVLYRVKAFGHFSTDANASPTVQLRVKLGTTVILDSGVVSVDDTLTDAGWNLECHFIVITAGGSGEIESQGFFMLNGVAVTPANTSVITVDTTTDQLLAVSAELGQADSDSITMRQLMIERHPYVGVPTPSAGYRVSVTVPDASIGATLTSFPVYVDLSTMPSDFWDHLYRQDGGDIRVKDSGGTDIPFDLIWIDYAGQNGALFYKQTLTNGGDTVAYIHYGSSTDALVPPTDPNGRNAVWSDYHRVFTFGADPFTDRTGSGSNLTPTAVNAAPFQMSNTSTSADLGVHQGVAWDGTHYYVVDDNLIKKYDAGFSLVASNTDPCGDIQSATGDAVDHCGDPCVVDGVLYVPAEIYVNVSTWSLMKIARFNASDLSYIGSDSIAAQNHEAASVCYRASDDMLYVASFADGSKLWKYARSDRSYQGTLSLSFTIPNIQGVTFWRDAFWINSDNASYDCTIRVTSSGTVQGRVWGIAGGNYEGIDFNDAGLLVLHDTTGSANGVVREIQPIDIAVGGGVDFPPSVSTAYLSAAVTRYTTWTIGASVQFDALTANMAMASYAQSGTASNTVRATLAYRLATTQMGLWNQTDSWLNDTLTPPSTGTTYRMHVTHTGTTNRRIYRNGANMQVDSGVVAKPDATANALLLGAEDASLTELMDGKLGFVYLRASELSADWIAAEYSNLSAPGSFYSVGSEESL